MSNFDKLKLTYEDGRQDSIILTSNTIESGEYQRQHIVSVEVPEIVRVIHDYAFCDNNSLANIVLNEGLDRIEGQAFQHGVYTAVTIPSTVSYIGMNAFNISLEQHEGMDSFTITCLAIEPPRLDDPEGITFGNRSCISAIYVPDESVSLYQEAWHDYADKIQGGAHPSYMFTNLDISAAYVGVDAVAKVYLGSDIVWELAPSDPCEGLTGESLCNCQGRYWWGGECHDEPEPEVDPMESIPLTFEITSVGTGTTGIGLRLSGNTSESNKRKVTYYLYHEGTEKKGTLYLNEAASNSAITSVITGLTVGDKIEFWGLNDQRGLSVSEKAFEYFVLYPDVTAKVYGNVNSLLFSGSYYHGRPVPQTGETDAYAFYRLFTGKSGLTFGAPDEPQHIVLPVPANGLQDSIYREMFSGCTGMITPPKLPATTLAPSCYRSMFNRAGLTTAPELPAETMADSAYLAMFVDCTSLTQAPALPATTLANKSYSNMFRGCTSLTQAPALPATTLADYCYNTMFSGCTSLTQAPALPATTLASYCYEYMFRNCTSLIEAPSVLPATTLGTQCYREMFGGCSSLTTAPSVLPATTLTELCYEGMFSACTSLVNAPALPATTLTDSCYRYMFQGCHSLAAAPELPATTLAKYCYSGMFNGCTSLTAAPSLPATTLASYCYEYMFIGCTSLTQAPELPATTLVNGCYGWMFKGCTNLNYIKCLATNPSNGILNLLTNNWVNGVAATGTFVKHPNATWTTGTSGIPTGWTVEDAVI